LSPLVLASGGALLGALVGFASTSGVSAGLLLLAAAVPVAFIVAVTRPDLAVAAYAALVFGDLLSTLTQFHGFPPLARPAGLVLLAAVLGQRLLVRDQPLARDPLTGWLFAYGLVIALGLLFARDRHVVLLTLIEMARAMLTLVIIVNVVTRTAQLRRILWAVLATGVLLASLTIYQSASGNWGQDFGGLARSRASDIVGDVAAPRPGGTFNDANFYGLSLIMLVPLGLFLALDGESLPKRLIGAACTVVLVLAIVLTYSRGDAVALAATFGAAALFKRVRPTPRSAVLAVAVLAVALVILPHNYAARMKTIPAALSGDSATIYGEDSIRGRVGALKAGALRFLDHQVAGVGAGNFPLYEAGYLEGTDFAWFARGIPAHNLYIEVAAETGVLGLAVVCAIFVVAWHSVLDAHRRFRAVGRRQESQLAGWLGVSLVGYMAGSLFLHGAYLYLLWLLLSLIAALRLLARQASNQRESASSSTRGSTASDLATGRR
jgi:O-antigen ligase